MNRAVTKKRTVGKGTRIFAGVLAALLCAVALAVASSATAGDWRIRIKPAAVLGGEMVTLGDIAVAVGDVDRARWDRLAATELWKPSKRKGRPVAISRKKLTSILRHYIGDAVRLCEIPSRVVVQTGGHVLLVNDIQQAMVGFLTSRIAKYDGEIVYRDYAMPDYIFFPRRFDKLKVSSPREVKPGRNSLRLEVIDSDGKVVRQVAASVFVDVWKAVPAAARIMNRGERITPEKLTFVRKNIAYMTRAWDGKGGPWRVKRPIGRGQAITRDSIEALPAVSRGDMVELVYQGKRVRLTLEVKAMDDGRIGQQVEVKNLQSNRRIIATVVSSDKVMVR
ncbi:flagellar basal body P-ring formation chaperone FlgA [Salidesulfovibrio brasiliensis]|uniref:flagellar basal body P-ring formation chaperone FlgA n=1 Tax=Salidesulfovibrio brasiliensis TaxID=221711 RepID=UPI0006D0D2B0|nr:flagellar basal body P-ring formation chaperone FlgA [Salidesulfovibrio brasiliensis]